MEPVIRPGDTVLDVGCGTGLLGIAAALMGADVLGVEIDPSAVERARANAELNGVSATTRFATTPVTEITGQFDVVVANVFRHVLVPLAPALAARCRRDLILSGLLTSEEAELRAAYSALNGVGRLERDGWLALQFRR